MREYDDDNIQHYAPVLRRIIILVAVITAVPVMLWTITAFMHTYIAQPTIPSPQTLAAATALNPVIGYDKGAEIGKEAASSGRMLKDVALEMGVDEETYDKAMDLRAMARGNT